MGTLEKVMQMQTKGMSDNDINQGLKKEGYSSQEINDAINQAKIKSAVSQGEHPGTLPQPPQAPGQVQSPAINQAPQNSQTPQLPEIPQNPQAPQGQQNPQTPQAPQNIQGQSSDQENNQVVEQMQESIMKPEDVKPSPEEIKNYNKLEDTMHAARQPDAPAPQEQPTQAPQYEEQFYPQAPAYPAQEYYPQQQMDTETITEITEQIVSEKLENFKEKLDKVENLKEDLQNKIDDIDNRLKQIENSIEKLQQAIIGKIGEFGENSEYIKKDLSNLHDTVSKLMNPLIDNYKELKKISDKN
jgi:tetrahydromethanopterin S-methyltransferase subunit B